MNLNYAIFRSEPVMTTQDLSQIGAHNKREKQAYNSNPDIKLELSKDNIELVPLAEKYLKGFDTLTKEYKKEHEERMKIERKSRKNILFDKEYVKVKRETFDSMNNVIKESKKVMEMQPKLQTIFNEVDNYANSYKSLEKENQKYEKEIKVLKTRNQNLNNENNTLKERIKDILRQIKRFFRMLLQYGTDLIKDETSNEIKGFYRQDELDMEDVVDISRGTTKEDELFDFVGAPSYLKSRKKSYDYEKDNDDFELGR